MRLSKDWGSHLPVLMKVVRMTTGPILEMGAGMYSTPFLHWSCFPTKRELVTYDNSEGWIAHMKTYQSDFHKVIYTDNWDKIPIERNWEVAFIDHGPDLRRHIDAIRLANFAKYVVIHDSEPKRDDLFEYEKIYPFYKYRYDFKAVSPNTTVLSNFVDLKDFKI